MKGRIILKWSVCILLAFLFFNLGKNVRLLSLRVWERHPETFMYDGKPIFTGYDSALYARYAKEVAEGKFGGTNGRDNLRFVPDGADYPPHPPLLSFVEGVMVKATGLPPEVIDSYLTPILAALVVFPIMIYTWAMGWFTAGITASLCVALSMLYVTRTAPARMDTDSLNLFFPVLLGIFLYLADRADQITRERIERKFTALERHILYNRTFYVACAGAAGLLWQWWYGKPVLAMIPLAILYSVVVARAIKGKTFKSEWVVIVTEFLLLGPAYLVFTGIANGARSVLKYLVAPTGIHANFPNVLQSISELQRFSFKFTGAITVGHWALLILGIAGVILMAFRERRKVIYFLPMVLIGSLCFFKGNRFAIYLVPIAGAGIGYLADFQRTFIEERWNKIVSAVLALMLISAVFVTQSKTAGYIVYPKITNKLVASMVELKKKLPKDAWVWTWWDYGYMFQYYSGLATFHDGGCQLSPKTYFIARSFTTGNYTEMVNIIDYVANTLIDDIVEDADAMGAEKLVDKVVKGDFYKGKTKHPVYIVFTRDMIKKFAWIHYIGSWDFKKGKGEKKLLKELVCVRGHGDNSNVLVCNNKRVILDLSPDEMALIAGGRKFGIGMIVKAGEDRATEVEPTGKRGFILVLRQKKEATYAYVVPDVKTMMTSFVQMYLLGEYDQNLFEKVYDNFPEMVVYRVKFR